MFFIGTFLSDKSSPDGLGAACRRCRERAETVAPKPMRRRIAKAPAASRAKSREKEKASFGIPWKKLQAQVREQMKSSLTVLFDRPTFVGAVPPNLRAFYNLDADGREVPATTPRSV
jgi:hypothetical protein